MTAIRQLPCHARSEFRLKFALSIVFSLSLGVECLPFYLNFLSVIATRLITLFVVHQDHFSKMRALIHHGMCSHEIGHR